MYQKVYHQQSLIIGLKTQNKRKYGFVELTQIISTGESNKY